MKGLSVRSFFIGILVALLFVGIAVYAQNVNSKTHPNLANAQVSIQKAIDDITAAQKANEFDMQGHAAKAKQLLNEAYEQIKLAAEAANRK